MRMAGERFACCNGVMRKGVSVRLSLLMIKRSSMPCESVVHSLLAMGEMFTYATHYPGIRCV